MTFTIRYEKTGKEIEVDDARGYLMLSHDKELVPLGFSVKDLI